MIFKLFLLVAFVASNIKAAPYGSYDLQQQNADPVPQPQQTFTPLQTNSYDRPQPQVQQQPQQQSYSYDQPQPQVNQQPAPLSAPV